MGFRFRQFIVEDQESTMKVGTDAMLLGAWASPPRNGRILDIGTGSGVLALMLAQKSEAVIDAVETDPASCQQAKSNFLHSPWPERLNLIEADFRIFGQTKENFYDFLICNPPFFSNSLKSGEHRKNLARHDTALNYSELFSVSKFILKTEGSLCTVFPAKNYVQVRKEADKNGLEPSRTSAVYNAPGSEIIRYLTEWKTGSNFYHEKSSIIIRDFEGNFSQAYLKLTKEYHSFDN